MNKKIKVLFFSLIILIPTLLVTSNEDIGKNTNNNDSQMMKVHYIDVGQGDAELIQVNGKNILIDSGSRSEEEELLSYLDKLKIKKLDYVIATHPHEDHIGNMDEVIEKYEIGQFYAPKITSTTKAFENMIKALKNKNLKINVINEGVNTINLGENTDIQVFSPMPNLQDKNLNNYSPVMKIIYGNNSFLFTGDAEEENEEYVLSKGYNISSDVLKAGHHGSSTSSTEKFIQKVNPSVTIISCGRDNKYGHPDKKTIDRLNKINSTIYRTDRDGDIVLISNGNEIWKEN